MAAELYARTATISRTQRLIEEKGVNSCARELDLCDLFCVTSGRRFRDLRLALEDGGETLDGRRRSIAQTLREEAGYRIPGALMEIPAPPRAAPSLTPPAAAAPAAETVVSG
jgi:acyl-CoA dehydrogenase family protein 9